MSTSNQSLLWHLNSSGVSNELLNDFLKTYGISKKFIGVFPYDKIPKLNGQNDKIMIINIGYHFVTVVITKNYSLYIDSFGTPCTIESVRIFLKNIGKPIYYNEKMIQGIKSPYCGMYACLFAIHFDSPLFKLVFCGDQSENDELCMRYLKMYNKRK